METSLLTVVVALAGALFLGRCHKSETNAPPPSLHATEQRTGATFGPSAAVLYYHIDHERLRGLEEWIVEAPQFRLSEHTEAIVRIADSAPLREMLLARLTSLHIPAGRYSERGKWERSDGSRIRCDVLYTGSSQYLFVTRSP